jgi:uncharacterized membrane protein YvbJ
MSLADKIEEIRQKPEREKIKYVWGMVFVCMIFIIFVWIFSFKEASRNKESVNSGADAINGFETLEKQENSSKINNQEVQNQSVGTGFSGDSRE